MAACRVAQADTEWHLVSGPYSLAAPPAPTPGAHTMTDTKALIAGALELANAAEWYGPAATMAEMIRRLAAALEEATVPEGWRVTETRRDDGAYIEFGSTRWFAFQRTGEQVAFSDETATFPTAREAMAALDGEETK